MDVISPSSLATANAHQPLARKVVLVLFAVFLVLPFVVALFSGGPFLEAIDWIWVGVTVLAAVVVIPLVWRSFAPPLHTSSAFEGAPFTIATLLSSRATGSSINDQPEVELNLEYTDVTGAVTQHTTKGVINLGVLPQFVPGIGVPIYHLPDGRVAIAYDATAEQIQDARDDTRQEGS